MRNLPYALKVSWVVCSIPGVLIAIAATIGTTLGWGGWSFSDPIYLVIISLSQDPSGAGQ